MKQPSHAVPMLILVTLLWGLSFPWMKEMQDEADDCPGGKGLASLTLIAIRMPLAVLVLAGWKWRLFTRRYARSAGGSFASAASAIACSSSV